MDKYIDFTNCPVDPYKGFRGAKGKKISITYNKDYHDECCLYQSIYN